MTVAVIQARMGSTRLPGKVMMDLEGRPVLSWVIRAARESGVIDDIVVATTLDQDDDTVTDLARDQGVDCFRGHPKDVLSRYTEILSTRQARSCVRLTADCPLLDPRLIKVAVKTFEADPCDYVGTTIHRTLPRGLDVEVASSSALERAGREARGSDRAHVTSYLYGNPELFEVVGLVFTPSAADLRVTLDVEEDAALIRAVVAELGDRQPHWREVVKLLRSRSDITSLNAGIQQRPPSEG